MRSNKKSIFGFTLIELMITVAVVAILAAIAYPSYVSTIRKARREDAIASLLELQLAQEKHRANNTTYTTTLSTMGFNADSANAGYYLSRDEYYKLQVSSATATAFTATASPRSQTPQGGDSCTFTLNQSGPYIANATDKACWNK